MTGTPQPSLTVVSRLNALAPSYRVRVRGWIEFLGIAAREVVPPVLGAVQWQRGSPRWAAANAIHEARARALRRLEAGPVLVQREATRIGDGGLETAILGRGDPSTYDIDDALYLTEGVASGSSARGRRVMAAVRSADRVIASNAVIAEQCAAFASAVEIIPSCVDVSRYEVKADYEVHDPPRIGWIGSASTENYLEGIRPALEEVHRRTEATLVIVGSSRGSALQGSLMPVTRIPWTLNIEYSALAALDVGIMPLADRPWERAKAAYKLVQYGAAALPILGSPVGLSDELLRQSGAPAPRTSGQWVDALLDILDMSASARAKLGRAARRTVETHYSYGAWEDTWRRRVGISQSSGA